MIRHALVALTVLASGVATHLSAQSAGHATTADKPTIASSSPDTSESLPTS